MSIATTTRSFGGNLAIARAIVSAASPFKLLIIGDSESQIQANGDTFVAELNRRVQRPLTDFWYQYGGGVAGIGGTGTVTFSAIPNSLWNSSVSGLLGLIGTYAPAGSFEIGFGGGTSGTGAYTDVPGQRIASQTYFTSGTSSTYALWDGDPWSRDLPNGTGGTFTALIVNNTAGNNISSMKFRVRGSDNGLTFSPEFTTNGTAVSFSTVSCTIPANLVIAGNGSQPAPHFDVDLCYKTSTSTPTGKNAIIPLVHLTTNAANGWGCFPMGIGGADWDFWNQSNTLAPDAFAALLNQMGFTHVLVMLGINNQTGYDAPSVQTKAAALIAKIRTAAPNIPVILVASHASASASTDPNAGGDTYEDYFVAPTYAAAVADGNCFFINANRQMGPQITLQHLASGDEKSDDTHLTQQGYVHLVDRIWGALLAAATNAAVGGAFVP